MSNSANRPIAFFSYVQNDDKHEGGRISLIRERLEGELRLLTGKPFKIFQDRNDISWGQQWEGRINEALDDVIFLIPIVTPTYFESLACRSEYTKFSLREQNLGKKNLIFPIYYVASDKIAEESARREDDIAISISSRQWTDWRQLRFRDIHSGEVGEAIHKMAFTIKQSMSELADIFAASRSARPFAETVVVETAEAIAEPAEATDISDRTIDSALISLIEKISVPTFATAEEDEFYFAFTKEFDEIVSPSELAEAEELLRLGEIIKPQINARREFFKRGQVKRKRFLATLKNFSVTLLIDNSGSLRGEKIQNCAAWCVVMMEMFGEAAVPLEILGFTTRAWKGGMSREKWLQAGKPENPGRLNDLRHLVYKSFEQSQTDAAENCYLMCREGLLKENIDGEAVIWAFERAAAFPSLKRIIVVISDGAPVDDSTMSVNDGRIFENHLRFTLDELERTPDTAIAAVGIEHDVDRYYKHSVKSITPFSLGPSVFAAITKAKEAIDK